MADHPDQAKWNQRYLDRSSPNPAAQVLSDNLHLLPNQGTALELACGMGGNALTLARQGLKVDAWDLSDVAIAKLQQLADVEQLPLRARCIDLSTTAIPANRFDLICVCNFLDRSLCPAISEALKPGGLLLYQTFTRHKLTATGPSNPEFLLEPAELLQLFSELRPVVYREETDLGDIHQGLRDQAYLVARKPV